MAFDIKTHLIQAGATALLVGGSAAVVQTKVDIARIDERVNRIERLDESMTTLARELATTREELARVSARQER